MKKKTLKQIFDQIRAYQLEKLEKFGPHFKGADWNSKAAQEIRFAQILKVCDYSQKFSILDYGCGYGGLFNYLKNKKARFEYYGFDILKETIDAAQKLFGKEQNCYFFHQQAQLKKVDYVVASGLFNLKFHLTNQDWLNYIMNIFKKMNKLSKKGFAFNMLTKYSDYYRKDLYYGDPCFFFDYCKRNFSRDVALLHDYGLYDFTIMVRK